MLLKLILLFFIIINTSTNNYNDIENVFIGEFNTFDPYELGENGIKDNIPDLSTDRIFLWIKNDSCIMTKNHKLLSKFKGKIEDDKDYEIYQLSEYKISSEITLVENQDIYFLYNGNKYNTKIEKTFCYKGWVYGYFASCFIPDELKEKDSNENFFPLIGSTNQEIQIFLDRYHSGQVDGEVFSYKDYKIESSIRDTGERGYFDAIVYDASLIVKYKDKEIYRFNSTTKLDYMVGDFNGNGKLDIYIQECFWGRLYLLVEFDKEKIYEKTYQQHSAC